MAEIDWFTLVPVGIVVVLHTAVVLAALPYAAKTCGGVVTRCGRATSAQESEKTAVHREQSLLAQRLVEIRASYFQELVHVWLHLCGVASFLYVANRFIGQRPDKDSAWSIIVVSSYISCLVLRLCPWLLNQCTLCVLHSWCMGLFMAYGVHVAMLDSGLYVYTSMYLQLIRVLVAVGYPEALPNFVWNAAWAALAIIATLVEAERLGIAVNNVVVREVACVFALSFVIHKAEQLQVSQVRSELEAKGHLRAKETVQNVLSDMCDAVVELNRHLDIQRPCARLAGLLIKPNSVTQMRGEAFPGLIFDDEDRERFSDFLLPRSVPVEQSNNLHVDGGASSVYVRLRDTAGTPVSVQLFHSCHHNPPEDICHIIGVREVQEAVNLEGLGQEEAIGVAQVAHENVDDETASVASSDTLRSTTTAQGPRMLAPVIPDHKAIDPVSAIVNPITLQIIACTTGFKSYTGPLVFKGSVRDIILNISDFESWLQEAFNERVDNRRPQTLELKLVPAMVREQPHFEFRANAYVLDAQMDVRASAMGVEAAGADTGDEQEEKHDMLCVLALRDVEAHWLRPKRSRSLLNTSRRPRRDRSRLHRNEGLDDAPALNQHSVAL